MQNDLDLMAGDESKMVGDMVESGGFGVGTAKDDARPTTMDGINRPKPIKTELGDSKVGGQESKSPARQATFQDGANAARPPLDRTEAYEMYKTGPGRQYNEFVLEKKAELKRTKARKNALSRQMNDCSTSINAVKEALQDKTSQRLMQASAAGGEQPEEDIVDEEEYRLMIRERNEKKNYKKLYAEFSALKKEMDGLKDESDRAKISLIEGFESWFAGGADGKQANNDVDEGDKLDDGEAFDQMEMERVVEQDPDSLAFFQAQKKMVATMNHDRTTQARKQKLKRKQ